MVKMANPESVDEAANGTWIDEHLIKWIDDRIDRKLDKMKLWLFGVVLANLIPVLIFAVWFGTFTGRIEVAIEGFRDAAPNRYTQREHEVYAQEVDRRFQEMGQRINREVSDGN